MIGAARIIDLRLLGNERSTIAGQIDVGIPKPVRFLASHPRLAAPLHPLLAKSTLDMLDPSVHHFTAVYKFPREREKGKKEALVRHWGKPYVSEC